MHTPGLTYTPGGACRWTGGGHQVAGHAEQGRQGPGQVQQAHRIQVRQASPTTHPTALLAWVGPVESRLGAAGVQGQVQAQCGGAAAVGGAAGQGEDPPAARRQGGATGTCTPCAPCSSVCVKLMGRVVCAMSAVGAHGRGDAARGQPVRAAAETQDHPGAPTTHTHTQHSQKLIRSLA